MKITNEIRMVGTVLGMLLILMAFLMYENTRALRENNSLENEEMLYLEGRERSVLQAEYDNLVLECGEPALKKSEDKWLRELCDETLPAIREELYGVGR